MPGIQHCDTETESSNEAVLKPAHANEGFMLGGKAPPPSLYEHKFGEPGYLLNYHGTNVNYPFYETLKDVEKFQARPSDVCIATFPKTGTTFTTAVVHMIMNQGDPKSLLEGPPLDSKVLYLEFKTPYMQKGSRHIDFIKYRPSPRVYFTHLGYYALPKSVLSQAKIIYVTRNPKDTITSMYYFLRAFPSVGFKGTLEDMAKSFFNNTCIYAPFYGHVAGYWKNLDKHSNILFISFEEIVKDFPQAIRRMADFLGQNLTDEQVDNVAHYCHFDQMKVNPGINRSNLAEAEFWDYGVSPFVRKGKVGNWKENFTPELNKAVDEWIKMEEKRIWANLPGFKFEYQ